MAPFTPTNITIATAADQIPGLSTETKISIVSSAVTIVLSIISTLISWASLQQIIKSNQQSNGNKDLGVSEPVTPTITNVSTCISAASKTFDDVNPNFRRMMIGRPSRPRGG